MSYIRQKSMDESPGLCCNPGMASSPPDTSAADADAPATENLLVRRQGKGTFVATHAEEKIQYRFLRLMPDEGAQSPTQRRVLDCRRLRALADIARALELKSGDAAVQIRRLLLVHD